MRQEVYVKFAEALSQKQAEARQKFVHIKFAETLQRQRLQKKAGAAMVMAGLRHAISAIRNGASTVSLGKNIGQLAALSPSPGAAMGRAGLSLRKMLSPKIQPGGKLDLRKLFSTTKEMPSSAPLSALQPKPGENVTQQVLQRLKRPAPVTRIDPAKVLSAAGGAAGGAALATTLSPKTPTASK